MGDGKRNPQPAPAAPTAAEEAAAVEAARPKPTPEAESEPTSKAARDSGAMKRRRTARADILTDPLGAPSSGDNILG